MTLVLNGIAMLVVCGLVSACGGGSPPINISGHPEQVTDGFAPLEQAVKYGYYDRRDVSWEGRQDYKEAMDADCRGRGEYLCSTEGTGWFIRWWQAPDTVVIPDPQEGLSSYAEEDVIRRAVAIVNRSLPADKRLGISYADLEYAAAAEEAIDRVEVGGGNLEAETAIIYADIRGGLTGNKGGVGWTDGRWGFALVNDSLMENVNTQEYAVQAMVHEILHAMGLMGHPHHMHTSVLSYQHASTNVLDNVPLIDVAVLYDMNGWGRWSGSIQTLVDTVDGTQFGVHRLASTSGSVDIPWVDAGFLSAPYESALRGTASWSGSLVGMTSQSSAVAGDADLRVNFVTSKGRARFHSIRHWNGNMWNRRGWSYDLYVNGTYFDSNDPDGIPDVAGAFYGLDAEVAAGTLQRPEITAAFGAERM